MFRKILFWCHLSAGVSVGIVVFVMSFTGLMLTYQKQMTEWVDRTYWPVAASAGAGSLPLQELVVRARHAFPGEPFTSIRFYSDPETPALVSTGGNAVYVNRYTGAIGTGRSESIRRFFRVMTDWHRWVGDETRSWGKSITGASNLVFLFIVLSGMYLWLPRKLNWQSLAAVTWFRPGLAGRARHFNWHNVFGFWMAVPLVFVVASATVISYPWATDLVYTLTGTEAPVRGARRGGEAWGPPARISLGGIDPLLEEVKRHVPRWRTIDLALPIAGPEVSFAIDRSFGQPKSRATLVLDRHSSAVVRFDTFADQNSGQRTRSWLRFVHTGEYYGVAGQTFAGLASLAGLFLVYTGFSLGLRRFLAWKQRKAQSA